MAGNLVDLLVYCLVVVKVDHLVEKLVDSKAAHLVDS